MRIQDAWLIRFKEVVQREIDEAGGKSADGYRAVATKTGLGYDYIYQIFMGKPVNKPKLPGHDAMTAIERVYGDVESSELAPNPPPAPIELEGNPDYPAIRRVQFKLSAGASGFAIDVQNEDDAPIVFRREWFESRGFTPANLFAVQVANGSMQPGLWHGDTVVVNTADTAPKDGEVFAVNFEGELVIKRLVHDEGRWWLRSDNPDQSRYPRKACNERVFIIGRIVHKQSEHL